MQDVDRHQMVLKRSADVSSPTDAKDLDDPTGTRQKLDDIDGMKKISMWTFRENVDINLK